MNFSPTSPICGKLSVLLYESDQSALDAYVSAFKKIFSLAEFEADIVPIASGGALGNSDEGALFDANYYDILISDVSLGDIENQLGLRFLTKIKDRHPDIFTVAFTGHAITYRSCSNKHRFDLYVDKQRVEVAKYQKYIAAQFQRELRFNPYAIITNRRQEFWPDISDAEWLDLQRIVRRITFTGLPNPEKSYVSNVHLDRIDGGYSGAHVFSLRASTGSGQICIHAILKVARTREPKIAEAIQREVKNYESMVRWHLPYDWRPELLGATSSAHLDALCYTFVSSREEPFEPLRKYVREGHLTAISHAIESIFHPTRRRWYDERNVRSDYSLVPFYLDHCFNEGDSSESELKVFRRTLKQYDTSAPDKIFINELEIPSPNMALFSTPVQSCQSCLIHGDLNTSNVLVSPSGDGTDVTLIDFASTRRGHVFFDFIVFEINLRLDCQKNDSLDIYRRIVQECELNSGKASDVPCAAEILNIREHAAANFKNERWDTYLYGVASFCFSLLTASNLSETNRRILCACICAALIDMKKRHFWPIAHSGTTPIET